jgi:DNA-binding transcriptional ArsR family regulator
MVTEKYRNIDVEELSAMADVLKVIAHPVRLEIIELLEVIPKMCVSEMLDRINIEQSQLSHHLSKMKDKGVLKSERDGKKIFYSLGFDQITRIFDCMKNCYL